MAMTRKSFLTFLAFYAATLLVQMVGGYFTGLSVQSWYPTLDKSPLTPPGYVFGIVWTMLYFLMAVAATRVHHVIGHLRNRPLAWWAIQLLLGLIWSIVFFGGQSSLSGIIIISATVLAVIVTLVLFWRVDALAGVLLLPLLLWLTLATHLNLYIVLHS